MALARCKRRNSERCMPDSNAPPPPAPEARQNAIDAFCESFAGDDLEMGEFETQLEMAHRAQSAEQLRLILADLPPAPAPVGNEVTDPRLAPNEVAASRANSPSISPSADLVPRPTLPEDRIPDHSVIVGIMGGGARSGSGIPAKNNWAMGLMGGCELDFRDAQLGSGVSSHYRPPPHPDAPILKGTGLAIMGGAGVTVRYPGETVRAARLRLRSERKARKLLEKGK